MGVCMCFVCVCVCVSQIFSIELTRGYGSNEFRDDLKKLYHTAGIAGEPVVFLFSDTQVREDHRHTHTHTHTHTQRHVRLGARGAVCDVHVLSVSVFAWLASPVCVYMW